MLATIEIGSLGARVGVVKNVYVPWRWSSDRYCAFVEWKMEKQSDGVVNVVVNVMY